MAKYRRSALVVGLGRFGGATARRLVSLGWDVVGVDIDPVVVQDLQDELEHIVQLDASDEEALATVNVPDFDVCIVARGGSIENSVLLVLNLQHLEARHIVAKAVSAYHARILNRLGVDDITYPELDAGIRLAESLQSPHLAQWMKLRDDLELAVLKVPKGRAGSTLNVWEATHRPSLQILAQLSPDGRPLTLDKHAPLEAGEVLVVLGKPEDIIALGG